MALVVAQEHRTQPSAEGRKSGSAGAWGRLQMFDTQHVKELLLSNAGRDEP
jgi:hypothetical protein